MNIDERKADRLAAALSHVGVMPLMIGGIANRLVPWLLLLLISATRSVRQFVDPGKQLQITR